ncbi:MAG: hypothetical protein ACI81P_000853 [Neolewinella sp.]|jgi:hypothetical protein
MRLLTLTLALITFLCTCGRAQTTPDKLPRDETNVAFIKGKTGFIIDSLTIRTTLDTVPYSFAFPNDTLLLDISIFKPADELTLETFAGGHSFGRRSCWVDAPTADVYLSVTAGRNTIDSVGLSPINRLYRREVATIRAMKDPTLVKKAIGEAIYQYSELLFAADFLNAFADLPNLNRIDIEGVKYLLRDEIGRVKSHPRFEAPRKKIKLLASRLPGKLDKYELSSVTGQSVTLETPNKSFYILNLYDSSSAACRKEHELIANSLATDSLFIGVPIFSISQEKSEKAWRDYVSKGGFSWPHYYEDQAAKRRLFEELQLYPDGTYVLINKRNLIEGVYNDVSKLAAALMWRRISGKLGASKP